MLEIAMVGCSHIHAPGFVNKLKLRAADVHVKYCWDPARVRAEKRAQALEMQSQVVDDPKIIWHDSDVKAVLICSETHRHQELVAAAARSKKHLFVEKPVGIGSRDSYTMVKVVEKAGVAFTTGYFSRSNPQLLFIKEQIDKGHFGKITRVRGSNCHGGALGGWFDTKPNDPADDWRWMADPMQSGVGAFGDLGTHSLDILLWWLGEVETCTASLNAGTARYPDCDETGEGLLKFKSGVIGTLAAAWDDVANPVSYLVSGTEGHAAVINGQLFFQSKHVQGADGKQPWTQLPEAHPHPLEMFLDAAMGKTGLPLVSIREAAYRSAVMEALYTSAKTGKWYAPKEMKQADPRAGAE